jgi:hypothetical protein
MSQIKAIETTYKGYRFRSRLEARWAVFFDTLGIEWKYEDQGYEKEIFVGEGRTETLRYLPDFFLPNRHGTGVFVEVKGDKQALKKEERKYTDLLDFGSVLPYFDDSGNTGKYEPARGLLLLGDTPLAMPGKTFFHPIVQHHKGLVRKWAFFSPNGVHVENDSILAGLLDLEPDWNMAGDDWLIETRELTTPRHYPRVYDAYAAARSARFEHGERGVRTL